MRKKIICSILILMLLSVPTAAFAGFNDYGYNAEACIFNGTFDNWENFVYERPASPVDLNAKDVMFLVRKWNKDFDNGMLQGKPLVDGAWQQAHFYQYLSGKEDGWAWNWNFKMVYSTKPLAGAVAVDGMPDFYIVQDKTWKTDPNGNEIIINEFRAVPPSLGPGFYTK